jgi:hypothetical protein
MMSTFNCRDCKYCEIINDDFPSKDQCWHPNAVFTHCSFERDPLDSVCGEEGILFEKTED